MMLSLFEVNDAVILQRKRKQNASIHILERFVAGSLDARTVDCRGTSGNLQRGSDGFADGKRRLANPIQSLY